MSGPADVVNADTIQDFFLKAQVPLFLKNGVPPKIFFGGGGIAGAATNENSRDFCEHVILWDFILPLK